MTVAPQQRFTREQPCPICRGYDAAPRGKRRRCFGFLSNDGAYAHCTREELADNEALALFTKGLANRISGGRQVLISRELLEAVVHHTLGASQRPR